MLGIWSYGEVDDGFEEVGADSDCSVSSGGCGCLSAGGGYHVLMLFVCIGAMGVISWCVGNVYAFDCEFICFDTRNEWFPCLCDHCSMPSFLCLR